MIKAIHSVVASGQQSLQAVPRGRLSINESTTLLWACTGRTDQEIAEEMDTAPATVRVYIRRAAKKLGISGKRPPLIAATLAEIIRDQQKAGAHKRV